MKSFEAPERIEKLLDTHGHLAVHFVGFSKSESPPLKRVSDILRKGLVPPARAVKIENQLGKRVFDLDDIDRKVGADPELRYKGRIVEGESFSKKYSERFQIYLKWGFRPALIIKKEGFTGLGRVYTEQRIQPRFILAIVLPYITEKSTLKAWIGELKSHGKPIYSCEGNLVWRPKS